MFTRRTFFPQRNKHYINNNNNNNNIENELDCCLERLRIMNGIRKRDRKQRKNPFLKKTKKERK